MLTRFLVHGRPERRRHHGFVRALATLALGCSLGACATFTDDYEGPWPPTPDARSTTTILIAPGDASGAPGFDWNSPSELTYNLTGWRDGSRPGLGLVNTLREVFAESSLFGKVRAGTDEPGATRVEVWYRASNQLSPPLVILSIVFTLGIIPFRTPGELQMAFRVVAPDGSVLGSFEHSVEQAAWGGWFVLLAMPFAPDYDAAELLAREAAVRVAEIVASSQPPADESADDDPWRDLVSPWNDDR